MGQAVDIDWLNLALGYLVVVVPVTILFYYRTGLVRDLIVAVIRMTLQLMFLGLYLEFIFVLNSAWLNLAWLGVMTGIAAQSITGRAGLQARVFVIPVFLSILFTVLLVDAFFLGAVIRLEQLFDARYMIPVSGMILGNCMRTNIVALKSFYGDIEKDRLLYRFALANGASRHEALLPYVKKALSLSFSPAIAILSVMGLISIPGMMTGQILGGSKPVTAIKYQILIALAIYVTAILSIYLSIRFSNRQVFDRYGNIRRRLMR